MGASHRTRDSLARASGERNQVMLTSITRAGPYVLDDDIDPAAHDAGTHFHRHHDDAATFADGGG